MAVTTSILAQGELTGAPTIDTLATGAGDVDWGTVNSIKLLVRFSNKAGATRTIEVWSGGATDDYLQVPGADIPNGGVTEVEIITDSTGDIRARADDVDVFYTVFAVIDA